MLKKSIRKRIVTIGVALVILVALAHNGLISLMANGIEEGITHKSLNAVKYSYLTNTKETLEDSFDKFFAKPKWRSFYSEEGQIVEFKGICTMNGKDIECVIQYLLSQDKSSYEFYAMEFNGIPQQPFMYMILVEKVKSETIINTDQQATDNIPVEDHSADDLVPSGGFIPN